MVRRPRTIQHGIGAGLRIDLNGADLAYAKGDREQPVQEALANCIHPGAVVYDIGANVGFFTILAARLVGSGGHVFAFEPVPGNVEAITHNLRLNRQSNATVLCVAVAEQTGRASFALTRHIGGAALASVGAPPDATKQINVDTLAIDDGVRQGQLRPPSVVKIDVEGAELLVLRGMTGTLSLHKPIVVFEVDDANQQSMQSKWSSCVSLLQAYGYTIRALPESYQGTGWHVAHGVAVPS